MKNAGQGQQSLGREKTSQKRGKRTEKTVSRAVGRAAAGAKNPNGGEPVVTHVKRASEGASKELNLEWNGNKKKKKTCT